MIRIQKPTGTWTGLKMVIDGQISETGVVTPSDVSSIIFLDYKDVQNVFDQFIELGDVNLNSLVLDIAGKSYTFNREMAEELLGVVSVTCNDHEGLFADVEYLNLDDLTEEYLLSL